eukprot:gene1606-1754_t
MGDWEDDDFEVPDLANNLAAVSLPVVEEVDEALKKPEQPLPIVKAAGVLKKQQEEAEALARKMESSIHDNETAEERRIRERKQVEEADAKLAGELFRGEGGGAAQAVAIPVSAAKSVAGIPLKTKEDHSKLGTLLSKRLATSSAFNVSAFYKSLMPALDQTTITTEVLDELIQELQSIRAARNVAEKAVKPAAAVKKSKKELEAEKKKHADKFGGFKEDVYDNYGDLEDQFM